MCFLDQNHEAPIQNQLVHDNSRYAVPNGLFLVQNVYCIRILKLWGEDFYVVAVQVQYQKFADKN